MNNELNILANSLEYNTLMLLITQIDIRIEKEKNELIICNEEKNMFKTQGIIIGLKRVRQDLVNFLEVKDSLKNQE